MDSSFRKSSSIPIVQSKWSPVKPSDTVTSDDSDSPLSPSCMSKFKANWKPVATAMRIIAGAIIMGAGLFVLLTTGPCLIGAATGLAIMALGYWVLPPDLDPPTEESLIEEEEFREPIVSPAKMVEIQRKQPELEEHVRQQRSPNSHPNFSLDSVQQIDPTKPNSPPSMPPPPLPPRHDTPGTSGGPREGDFSKGNVLNTYSYD